MKDNWYVKKLDKVCDINYGTRVVHKRDGGTIFPVYGGGGATFFMDTYNREDQLVIARFAMSEQCTRFVSGKFFLNDSGLTITTKNKNKLDQKFLDYQALFLNEHIYSLARGTAQKNLDVPAFRNISISFPKSLSEQKQIVTILDKIVASINSAKGVAQKNLQNSSELFDSYLQSVFENPGKEWRRNKLADVCEIKPPKKQVKSQLNDDDSVSFVPMADLGVLAKDLVAIKEKPLKEAYKSYTYFSDNDVILAKITPCFENGKIGIARNLKNGIGFGSSEYIVLRSNNELVPDYLYYFLSREQIRQEGKRVMTGAVGHKRIPNYYVENIEIPYPQSISEQKNIVLNLDRLAGETKKLEAIYQQKLESLDELKESILEKAFKGELTGA